MHSINKACVIGESPVSNFSVVLVVLLQGLTWFDILSAAEVRTVLAVCFASLFLVSCFSLQRGIPSLLHASDRDHPSRAHPRPRRFHQRCHSPLAARSVRLDGLLRDPLWSRSNGRGRRRRWRWNQPEHRWKSVPAAHPARGVQQHQADRSEARHHLQRQTNSRVQRACV